MKNILITGGTGYIGGRLSNYLKTKKPSLNIILASNQKPLSSNKWIKDFKFCFLDVLNKETIINCLQQNPVDTIIHLAALNEIDSLKNPELALEVNTKGTYNLLDLALKNGTKKFIYFSTFHVYGKPDVEIITEQTPTFPFHPYAFTHRAAEDFVNYFKHYHKMQTLIFRLSNSYGYAMDKDVDRWTLVFNDLCRQAVTTEKIVLRSSGKEYRDYISLEDVTRAVYHFLFNVSDWGDGLYNLGGECSKSVLEIVKIIKRVYKSKYNKEISEVAVKKDLSDIKHKPTKFSIDKLKKTGFMLQGNMNYEIEKTLALCEDFLNEQK